MKQLIYCALAFFYFPSSYAQSSFKTLAVQLQELPANSKLADNKTAGASMNDPVYITRFKVDAPIIAAGVGLTYLGVTLINDKKNLTDEELARKSKSDVPFFDRSSAGWYSKKIDKDSYIPFQFSFATPIIMMLINKNERTRAGQIMVMYTETMAITGTLFTMAAGLVQRSRPFVYGDKASIDLKKRASSQRAFYSGHAAASAAATFFAAKVFQDLNPGSKAKPYVWTIAATIPAVVGYMRYKAGMHFLSDNILGYALGAASGILVPQLHKNKALKNISLSPGALDHYNGITLSYHF